MGSPHVWRRDESHKRRVSCCVYHPTNENLLNAALVEYSCTFPDLVKPHGNSESRHGDYIRVTENAMRATKLLLPPTRQKEPKRKLCQKPNNQPRDLKQIYNVKYSVNIIRKSTFGFIQQLAKSINSLNMAIESSWIVRIDIWDFWQKSVCIYYRRILIV